jgi:hypothetical protein
MNDDGVPLERRCLLTTARRPVGADAARVSAGHVMAALNDDELVASDHGVADG